MQAALGHYTGDIITGLAFAIALLASVRGDHPERIGAAALATAWCLADLVVVSHGHGAARHLSVLSLISVPVLSIDLALSLAFLVLALRFGSLWLGAAMLAQGVQLGVHAFYISDDGQNWFSFAMASNMISGLLLLCLLAAILTSWRRRLRLGAPRPAFG